MPRKVYTKDWPRVPFSLHLSYFGYRHFRAKLVASGGSGNCWEPGRFSARLGMGGRASRSSLHVAGENIGGRTWKNNKHCRRSVLLLPNQAKSIACAHPQPLLLQCGPKTVRQRLRNCKYELQHRLTHVSSMREREGEPWKTQKSTLSIRPDVDGMTSKQSRKWLHRTIYNFSATIASYHFQQAPPMILLALIPKAWN